MRKYHRFISYLLILSISALFLQSCDKKDSDNDEDRNPLGSSPSSPLVGSWVFVKAEMEFEGQSYTMTAAQMGIDLKVTFNSDGSATWAYTGENERDSGTGSWSADGNQLTLSNPDGTVDTVTYSINGAVLKIVVTVDGETVTEYYEKQS